MIKPKSNYLLSQLCAEGPKGKQNSFIQQVYSGN